MSYRLLGAAALVFALVGGVSPQRANAQADAKDAKKPAEPTALGLLQQGMENAQKGDFVKATDLVEKATKLEPKNRQAIFILAALYQHRAGLADKGQPKLDLIVKSADTMRKLRDIDGKLQGPQEKGMFMQALYNEACAYAIEKKDDKAIASLTAAVDAGFSETETLNNDEDLASIRKRPEFTALAAKVTAAAKKELDAMIVTVKEEMHGFKSFPFDFELSNLEDKPVKLADFKGKVTIVDVWGTWCPPCRAEIPHFIALKTKYEPKGLAIVGINYENGDKSKWKAIIGAYVKETKMNYPCLIGDQKTQELIPEFGGFPTTLFIDREGKVRYKRVGMAPLPVLEAIVTILLEEPAKK